MSIPAPSTASSEDGSLLARARSTLQRNSSEGNFTDASLGAPLSMDSFEFIRLVVALEGELGIRFEDNYMSAVVFADQQALVSYVVSLMKKEAEHSRSQMA